MRWEWDIRRLRCGVTGFRCSCGRGREVKMDKIEVQPESENREVEEHQPLRLLNA
jgi:hypothetical protein